MINRTTGNVLDFFHCLWVVSTTLCAFFSNRNLVYLQVLQSYFASIIFVFSPKILLAQYLDGFLFGLLTSIVWGSYLPVIYHQFVAGLLSLGNSDALALTALQGAISSCFAKLPEQQAAELAGEAWGKEIREVVWNHQKTNILKPKMEVWRLEDYFILFSFPNGLIWRFKMLVLPGSNPGSTVEMTENLNQSMELAISLDGNSWII